MTPRRKKLLWIAGGGAGLLLLLVAASLIVMQTQWFADFVRAKIIATLEDSTGAKVEIGSFRFEAGHLTAIIKDLVIHGTEAKTEEPLARVKSLELRLKLFSGLRKALDLAYLGFDTPRVNIISNADGTTNIPEPKVSRPSSPGSSLATVVDLAVGQFRLDNGLIAYSQKTMPLSMRGNDLKVSLDYNSLATRYQGFVRIDALKIASKTNPPLLVRVNLPLEIRRDGLSVSKAQLDTDASHVFFSASLENPSTPMVTVTATAKILLPEMARAFDLPIGRNIPVSMSTLIADLAGKAEQNSGRLTVQRLRIAVGQTAFDMAGTADPTTGESLHFSGDTALSELAQILNIAPLKLAGDLKLNGTASLDRNRNYAVHGTLDGQGLALAEGSTRLSNVSLTTPFDVTADRVSLPSLRLGVLGGDVFANVAFLEMHKLSAQGQLHNIALRTLSGVFAGQPVDYGGLISGTFAAADDTKTRGTTALNGRARLSITPTSNGVPVSGAIDANYSGASGLVEVKNANISLPSSKLTASGSLNKSLNASLVSRNLNDFLPALRLGGGAPPTLPVTLKGGVAKLDAHIQGDLSAPIIAGHASITQFAAQNHLFDDLSLDFAASPKSVSVQNGSLRRASMQSAFDGSLALVKWRPVSRSPLSTNLTIRNADLGDLLALAGSANPNSSAAVQGDVHIRGTYGDPLGAANVQVSNGVAFAQSFDRASAVVNLAHELVTLDNLDLEVASGKISLQGEFRHPADRFTTGHAEIHLRTTSVNLANVAKLQAQNAGIQGLVGLTADMSADVREKQGQSEVQISNVSADASATSLRVRNQNAGSLTAKARTSSGDVIYTVQSDFANSTINVDGRTALTSDYRTTAHAVIHNLPLQNALAMAGEGDLPVVGILSADAAIAGTLESPNATAQLELTKASVYREPINRLTAKILYKKDLVDIPQFDLGLPAGTVNLTGRYNHGASLMNGALQVTVKSSDLDVAKIKQIQQLEPGLSGKIRIDTSVAAKVRDEKGQTAVQLSSVNADINAAALRVANTNLGDLKFSARTNQSNVTFHLDSNLAQSEIHASGTSKLVADYPTQAEAIFKNVRYENLTPLLTQDLEAKPPVSALVEGKVSVDGPLLNSNALAARLELSRLQISSNTRRGQATKVTRLENDQPITISLNKHVLTIQRFAMRGPNTSFQMTGALDLANDQNPLKLNLNGNLDLGILQELDRDFYSSGTLALKTSVRGTLTQPSLNGQIALQKANINYDAAPNGLSNANGVILLNGNIASVKNLTAESGGGKLSLAGSVALSPRALIYNLRANANGVRSRYSGLSVTSSANVTLTGTSRRSLISGAVSIERIAYSSSSDIGSLLSNASSPPSTPTKPSPFLSGMRLDIRVTTASDVRVVTSYVEKISLSSNLAIRGTAAEPGIVGRINITDGQLVFFGNTYNVNTGMINFYDVSSIRPELNLSLETIAQGVDVTLGVTGPMSDMKLTYRSDPPLSFEQIVQLLATNTTPFDPTIAAHQPTPPQQSLSQMGESQALGAAVANPLASRVQRVFGLTQFRIDPSVAGNNGQPTAKVTLRQKITNNLTFTYITDVTQTNSEIVRVQYDINSSTSAVALRDYNGNVSLQLFYKFQVR